MSALSNKSFSNRNCLVTNGTDGIAKNSNGGDSELEREQIHMLLGGKVLESRERELALDSNQFVELDAPFFANEGLGDWDTHDSIRTNDTGCMLMISTSGSTDPDHVSIDEKIVRHLDFELQHQGTGKRAEWNCVQMSQRIESSCTKAITKCPGNRSQR
jgi:hypothetical protein